MGTNAVQEIERDAPHAWDLTALPAEVGLWRARVGVVLASWDASPWAVHVVQLGVSELVGNVAKHVGDPRCRLEVLRVGGAVRVQVRDRSPDLPVIGEPSWESESGRGLWMLGEMVRLLGWTRFPGGLGKTTWFWCDLAVQGAEDDR